MNAPTSTSWAPDALSSSTDDVERLRRQRDELAATVDGLRAEARAREEYVAMVVHELGAPISVIVSMVDILQRRRDALPVDVLDDLLARTTRNARELTRLSHDLLTPPPLTSDRFAFFMAPCDMGQVVTEVAGELAQATGRQIEVEVTSDIPAARADEGRQRQILRNLLRNAVQYSDHADPVSVSMRPRHSHLEVSVRDRGPGLASEQVHQLFQPFTRLAERSRPDVAGSGLGLCITKALVEGQGGTIAYGRGPQGGSTFTYTVPVDHHGQEPA